MEAPSVFSRIDPTVDFAFKWLFGKEQNLPLLIDLLNAILKPTLKKEIVSLELLNPFNDQDNPDDKLSIVDVKARDSTGRLFDIEMQLLAERSFTKRILYYWADLHQQQLNLGDAYSDLRPTYTICFTDFVLFPAVSEYCIPFELCNRQHNVMFSSDMLVVVLELPKFKVKPEKIRSPLDAWLYFLCNAEGLDSENLPSSLRDKPEIRKALEELEVLSQNDLERERYKARFRVLTDEKSRLISAHDEGRSVELIGKIHFCQDFLGLIQTPPDQLREFSLEELQKQAENLQDAVMKQRKK